METFVRLYHKVEGFWSLWLLIFFMAIVFWVMRPSKRKKYQKEDARIPFEDDETNDSEK